MKTNFRSSIQILSRSVLLLSPLGPLWARFPYMFSRNLNTKLGRIAVPSISQLLSQRLPLLVPQLWRSVRTVSRLPDTGYGHTCDYFEIMNKRILIQQRAFACFSKSVAHILQRELYTMINTGLLRCEAKMTLLQPHLWDSRCQELRKKGTPKDSQGFLHHNKKRGSYRKCPYGCNSSQSSNQFFPQVGGNQTTEASEVIFDPIQGDEGVETPPPVTPYKPPSVHQ